MMMTSWEMISKIELTRYVVLVPLACILMQVTQFLLVLGVVCKLLFLAIILPEKKV
jgi:hypothetical protein